MRKRWVAVLEFIDMLPTASRYAEAVANDPEKAAQLAARPKPAEPWTPKLSEYDLQAMLLREAVHEMRQISQQLVGLAHGTPRKIQLFPGPRTAIDRAVAAMERQHIQQIAALLGFSPEDL